MNIKNVLSYIGGYLNTNEFELDITKIADAAELSEDETVKELEALCNNGDIKLSDNKLTLINITPKINKKFNELYNSVETFDWTKNTILKLDK